MMLSACCVVSSRSAPCFLVNGFISIMLSGGGAPEMEVAVKLRQLAHSQHGAEQYCWRFVNCFVDKAARAFADALEVVPFTLAENAGLSPIHTVTELRNQHANGHSDYGVNVRKASP